MTISAEEIYARHIKHLPAAMRLRFLEITAHDLVMADIADRNPRSLLELEGLGVEFCEGIEAQSYVNALRQEWDHRP